MRVKVELDKEVLWFVRWKCSRSERRAFYAALDAVTADPVSMIERSEAVHDPLISRYMLRYFRFAGYIAIFKTSRARDRICVTECRKPERDRKTEHRPNGRP